MSMAMTTPKRKRVWKDPPLHQVEKMRLAGHNLTFIAKALQTSQTRIAKDLEILATRRAAGEKDLEKSLRDRQREEMAQKVEQLRALVEQGLTRKQCMLAMGIGAGTYERLMKAGKIKRPESMAGRPLATPVRGGSHAPIAQPRPTVKEDPQVIAAAFAGRSFEDHTRAAPQSKMIYLRPPETVTAQSSMAYA